MITSPTKATLLGGVILAATALANTNLAADDNTCIGDAQVQAISSAFLEGARIAPETGAETMKQAICGRSKVVNTLMPKLGPVVGYKAAITSKGAQKFFNVKEPALGVLLKNMLVQNGSEVSVGRGGNLFEGDLILEVGSAKINDAKTPLEVLQSTKSVYPFMEVPRGVFSVPPPKIGGLNFTVGNAFAWAGVLGEPLLIQATEANVKMLGAITVVLEDADGKEVDRAKSSKIMGNPLNAAIWIAKNLKESGGALKAGDLISLGSITGLHPAKPGNGATVRYEGLPGNPQVKVKFVD